MPKETDRIIGQMRQAFEGEAWHGPCLIEILHGIDATTAAAKPLPNTHSIWEILRHLLATQRVIASRLQGIPLELSPNEDWPKIEDPSQTNWTHDLSQLIQGDQALRNTLQNFPDDRLDQPLVPGGTSAYNNLHGYIQHTLYHLAQIALIKRLA